LNTARAAPDFPEGLQFGSGAHKTPRGQIAGHPAGCFIRQFLNSCARCHGMLSYCLASISRLQNSK